LTRRIRIHTLDCSDVTVVWPPALERLSLRGNGLVGAPPALALDGLTRLREVRRWRGGGGRALPPTCAPRELWCPSSAFT
jgi:hypothetical protein